MQLCEATNSPVELRKDRGWSGEREKEKAREREKSNI